MRLLHPSISVSIPPSASNRSRQSPPSFVFLTYSCSILFIAASKAQIFNFSPQNTYASLFLTKSTTGPGTPRQLPSSRPWPIPVRLLRPLNRGDQCEGTLPPGWSEAVALRATRISNQSSGHLACRQLGTTTHGWRACIGLRSALALFIWSAAVWYADQSCFVTP